MIGSGELQPTWHAADCKLPDGTTGVYMSCDGFMAPTVTDPTNADFGRVTSQTNLPRDIQLAMKIVF